MESFPNAQAKPPVDAVTPSGQSKKEDAGSEERPSIVPEIKPTPNRAGQSHHCKPDATPWWKMLLEVGALFVGAYVAWVYHGQLNQMIESNRISRDSLQVVQRAAVSFSDIIKPLPVSFSTDKRVNRVDAWQIAVPMSNDGNTYTRSGKVHWNWIEPAGGLPLADNFMFPDNGDIELGNEAPGPFVLGPHQTTHTAQGTVPIQIIKNVQDHKSHFYVYGWATYRDVFEGTPEHITRFCYELSQVAGNPLVAGKLELVVYKLCHAANGRTLNNCFDEECRVAK